MLKYRKNIRLKNYDYRSNSAYFVTICTDFKQNLIKTREKQIVESELRNLPSYFKGLTIDYFQTMGTHLHVILLLENCSAGLPQIVGAFKSLTTLKLKRNGYKNKYFWQKNYYEHVIRNGKALNKIREYIRNNPLAEKLEMEKIYDNVGQARPLH